MKKARRRPARKAAKSKRKAIVRHSRKGASRRKPKRVSKAKATRTPKTSRPKKATRKAKPAAPRAKSRAADKTKHALPAIQRRRRGEADRSFEPPPDARGLGGESAGQSGDTEGLSRAELADSESVEELVEEGQAFEAGVISGVENAPDADKGGVRTRQVPEDDVPQEYLDED
jgi:hypothetical protein